MGVIIERMELPSAKINMCPGNRIELENQNLVLDMFC